ncbi:MAG: hypothetical protein GY856_11410 [bacterium]|nr:hypothetical protein [bacterium]
MAKQVKYLVTVDPSTGEAVKMEKLGTAGELTAVGIPVLLAEAFQSSPDLPPLHPARPYVEETVASAPPVPIFSPTAFQPDGLRA